MTGPGFYTPQSAAEVIGCTEQEVLDHIKAGRLKGSFLANVADYVIVPNDLMAFLKATRDFKMVHKMLSRHVLLVDRDPRVVDIMRMELGRQGCEVKVATTNREISFMAGEFMPDVICIHLGSTTRGKDAVNEGLERARRLCRSHIILYHNWSANVTVTPEMIAQIESVKADRVVVLDRSVTPLVDAVREKLGLKASGVGPYRPPVGY
jgi:CheY-like chemotaxis protein